MQITEKLITSANRPRRSLSPTGLCVHWTANTRAGANAYNHYLYWQNHPDAKSSAHYVVDDKTILRLIPENEVAWHAGGAQYTDLAKRLFNSRPNDYLLGMEMCVNSDGDWGKTYQNAVWLAADIGLRYGWGVDRLFRHYDMTKKDCPRMMTPYVSGGEQAWARFKQDVQTEIYRRKGLIDSMRFVDTKGHWAEADIEQAAEWGLVAQPSDKRFRPNDGITRAETVVLLVRAVRFVLGEVRKMLKAS